jgi:hypothetical protein
MAPDPTPTIPPAAAALPIVAVLFADPRGPYSGQPGVELWDLARDARRYAGSWPVVAHPPCARWGKLYHTGPLGKAGLGKDEGCFAAALAAAERCGGVLEHPEGSLAWPAFRLPRPRRGEWLRTTGRPGWVTEVDQAAYGHRCRKTTWLYFVGSQPADLRWGRTPGEAYITTPRRVRDGRVSRITVEFVTRRERFLTPVPFRDLLLSLVRASATPAGELGGRPCAGCGRPLVDGMGTRPGPRPRTCGATCRQRVSRRSRGLAREVLTA